MPAFGITPASGYPPATDQGFPRFIQWQVDGVDIGSRALVETVNVVGGAEGSVNSGGDTLTLDVSGAGGGGVTWRDVPGDYEIVAGDAENGLSASGNSGAQSISVPSADATIAVGKSVVVMQYGAGTVDFVAPSGISLLYRNGLLPQLAGQYAVATLMKVAANTWVLCGDLAS